MLQENRCPLCAGSNNAHNVHTTYTYIFSQAAANESQHLFHIKSLRGGRKTTPLEPLKAFKVKFKVSFIDIQMEKTTKLISQNRLYGNIQPKGFLVVI